MLFDGDLRLRVFSWRPPDPISIEPSEIRFEDLVEGDTLSFSFITRLEERGLWALRVNWYFQPAPWVSVDEEKELPLLTQSSYQFYVGTRNGAVAAGFYGLRLDLPPDPPPPSDPPGPLKEEYRDKPPCYIGIELDVGEECTGTDWLIRNAYTEHPEHGPTLLVCVYRGETNLGPCGVILGSELPRDSVTLRHALRISREGKVWTLVEIVDPNWVLREDELQTRSIPTTLKKVGGDAQQGPSGKLLAEPLVVSVKDQNRQPLPGVVVTFAVAGEGGTLSAVSDTTDAEGLAVTALTLGEELGTYTVVATVADLEPVTFTITAKASPDFDGDGEVGFEDFFLFAGSFGGSDPRFDLDASGVVDLADFFLFAESFGQPQRAKVVALARERLGLPDGPQLQQNAPNPFTSGTVISWFQLLPGSARLEVFALTGQRMAVLHEGRKEAGLHLLRWDGRDERGRSLASGVYVYRLVTREAVQTRKLTLLR